MKTSIFALIYLVTSTVMTTFFGNESNAQAINPPQEVFQLEMPDFTQGIPVMKALKERRTNRSIADSVLSVRHLSGLLWAANGQNREDGKRTAPSTMNMQMTDIYVVTAGAVFLYLPARHQLVLKAEGDYRRIAGSQDFVHRAPVNLVFVADFGKWKGSDRQPPREELVTYAGIEAGAQAQNVYLYGASEGLAVVIRGSVNRTEMTKTMNLTDDQYIIAAQTVGYPEK